MCGIELFNLFGKRHFANGAFPYFMNLRGWIKVIYGKITLIYFIENETYAFVSDVQNIGNGVF